MKKILRIKRGQYLQSVNDTMLTVTHRTKKAIDLNELSWVEISRIFSNLHSQGFKELEVIEVAE